MSGIPYSGTWALLCTIKEVPRHLAKRSSLLLLILIGGEVARR
jgi:hypothetical protein